MSSINLFENNLSQRVPANLENIPQSMATAIPKVTSATKDLLGLMQEMSIAPAPSEIKKEVVVASSLQEKKPENFDFNHEITEINKDDSIKDKDVELATRFCKIINPGKHDGDCANCAFYTHMHLAGHPLKREMKEGFQDWFVGRYFPRFDDNIVLSEPGETYGSMKARVVEKIQEVTQTGESVLISVNEGSHWFNAYNDGERVWFIDSQTGRGYNMYLSVNDDEAIKSEEAINIIHVSEQEIAEHNSLQKRY